MQSLELKTDTNRKTATAVHDFISGSSELVLPPKPEGGISEITYNIAIAMQAFYEEMDKVVKRVRQDLEYAGTPVVCKERCTKCCTNPVNTDLNEAILIAEYLKMDHDRLEQFKQDYLTWSKKVDLPTYTRALREIIRDETRDTPWLEIQNAYDNADCTFLGDDLCTIYGLRPAVCRQVLHTGPGDCLDFGEERVRDEELEGIVGIKLPILSTELQKQLDIPSNNTFLMPFFTYHLLEDPDKIISECRQNLYNFQLDL